jgi:hypothetical protein
VSYSSSVVLARSVTAQRIREVFLASVATNATRYSDWAETEVSEPRQSTIDPSMTLIDVWFSAALVQRPGQEISEPGPHTTTGATGA